jgi:hypothetical protein
MLEPIILHREGHEHEKPSCDVISLWLNKYMTHNFDGRDVFLKQLENAKYYLYNGPGYISVKFLVDPNREKYYAKHRVPMDMFAFQVNKEPVEFLLHVVDGVVDELELYTADGSSVDDELTVDNVKYKVVDGQTCTYNIYDL